jgi:hypothetical protein
MYPYNLNKNPFPSSPTPNLNDALILGGKRHKEARNSIFSCIKELEKNKESNGSTDNFRIITVIQDVGSGKTHLTLNIKISEIKENTTISYLDLSQVYPKTIPSIYQSIINGFQSNYLYNLKKELLYYVSDKTKVNNKISKKVFKLGFFESLTGKGIDHKILQILERDLEPDLEYIDSFLDTDYNRSEISIIKKIILDQFEDKESITLIDMINRLSILSKLNLQFFSKLSLYQFDEFDNNRETISFMKALINAHIPNTVLMLILTPAAYLKISSEDSSVFDRLEKANYKIDLAGSNSFEEISNIVLEYIKFYSHNTPIPYKAQMELLSKIKILYDDFDFRNIRSILNIMYNAFEVAEDKNILFINEQVLDETLQKTYPGVRIKGSIMNISISDYIKVKNQIDSVSDINIEIVESLRVLIKYLHKSEIKCKYEDYLPTNEVNIVYKDYNGSTSQISMLLNTSTSTGLTSLVNKDLVSSSKDFNKYPNVWNNNNDNNKVNQYSSINLDHSKIVDLLYMRNIIHQNLNTSDDHNKIILLARSINLC